MHDEDGRPVCRIEAQGHDSLTDFLRPLTTLHLEVTARKDERQAIAQLFKTVNSRNLSLRGDPKSRPLFIKSVV